MSRGVTVAVVIGGGVLALVITIVAAWRWLMRVYEEVDIGNVPGPADDTSPDGSQ